jgi:hypothetical protein
VNGINDLKNALAKDPDLAGGREILELLERKHRELSPRRPSPSKPHTA